MHEVETSVSTAGGVTDPTCDLGSADVVPVITSVIPSPLKSVVFHFDEDKIRSFFPAIIFSIPLGRTAVPGSWIADRILTGFVSLAVRDATDSMR